MTTQQLQILNTKLQQLRALTIRVQISNILTAQAVSDANRAIARLKGIK